MSPADADMQIIAYQVRGTGTHWETVCSTIRHQAGREPVLVSQLLLPAQATQDVLITMDVPGLAGHVRVGRFKARLQEGRPYHTQALDWAWAVLCGFAQELGRAGRRPPLWPHPDLASPPSGAPSLYTWTMSCGEG